MNGTDDDIRNELKKLGVVDPGPVTDSTRDVYRRLISRLQKSPLPPLNLPDLPERPRPSPCFSGR